MSHSLRRFFLFHHLLLSGHLAHLSSITSSKTKTLACPRCAIGAQAVDTTPSDSQCITEFGTLNKVGALQEEG